MDKKVLEAYNILREYVCEQLKVVDIHDLTTRLLEKSASLDNSGIYNSGIGNTRIDNNGIGNSGYCNSGNRNTGNDNEGHQNSGDHNVGCNNAGYSNLGDHNSGDHNVGCNNAGYSNLGDHNSGLFNVGNHNAGNFNIGDYHSGYYCTENQPIYLFNKPAPKNWKPNEFPTWMLIEPTHPDYVKKFWQDNFREASKAEIEETLALPNFDYEIFEEITSISKAQINEKLAE